MHLLALLALMLVMVWGTWALLRGGVLLGASLVLLAAVCFGHPFFHVSIGPIPLTIDRVLWLVLLGQYFLWRQMGWTTRRRLTAADWSLVALLVILAASTLTGNWHRDGNRPLARLIFYWAMPAGVYLAVRSVRLHRSEVRRLLVALAVFGIYLATTSLAEVQQWSWLVFPRYIASEKFPEFLGRARGPLMNPAGTGILEVVCLGALLWWLLPPGRWRRATCLVAAAFLMGGIFATLTRSVWLTAGVCILLFLSLTLPRNWRLPAVACLLLVGSAVGATQWERIMALKRDRDLDAQAAAESVRLRPLMAVLAWRMFTERPVLGCGFGQFERCKIQYIADRSGNAPLEQVRPYELHNVFLAILVETGIVGLLPLVLLLWFWTRDAIHLWLISEVPAASNRLSAVWSTRPLALLFFFAVTGYVINGMFHEISGIPGVNLVLFFLAGITQAALWNGVESSPGQRLPAETSSAGRPENSWLQEAIGEPAAVKQA